MATLYTKRRKVPKLFRNKRTYTGTVIYSSTATAQGEDIEPEGYTAGDGLELDIKEFNVVPDGTTIEINGSNEVALKADAITSAYLADGAVNTEHFSTAAVDLTAMAPDSVNGSKIADDSIDSEHYVDGSIDTAHLADDSVTADKLAADTKEITASHDSTPEDPGGSSSYVKVATLTIDSPDINVGDHITCKFGAICSGTTGQSLMGVGVRHWYLSNIDGIPTTSQPAVDNQFVPFPNNTNMAVMEFNLYILSTTLCAWDFKYIEVGQHAGTQDSNIEGGMKTLVNTTFGTTNYELEFVVEIKDTSGNDEIEFQFAHLQHLKNT
jgi:hypothetical protein